MNGSPPNTETVDELSAERPDEPSTSRRSLPRSSPSREQLVAVLPTILLLVMTLYRPPEDTRVT